MSPTPGHEYERRRRKRRHETQREGHEKPVNQMVYFILTFLAGAITGVVAYLVWAFWYMKKKAQEK